MSTPPDNIMKNLLAPYRARIDAIDAQIVDLLAKRLQVIEEVAALKEKHGIPAVLKDRVDQVIDNAENNAPEKHKGHLRALYTMIVDYACALEERLMRRP